MKAKRVDRATEYDPPLRKPDTSGKRAFRLPDGRKKASLQDFKYDLDEMYNRAHEDPIRKQVKQDF